MQSRNVTVSQNGSGIMFAVEGASNCLGLYDYNVSEITGEELRMPVWGGFAGWERDSVVENGCALVMYTNLTGCLIYTVYYAGTGRLLYEYCFFNGNLTYNWLHALINTPTLVYHLHVYSYSLLL